MTRDELARKIAFIGIARDFGDDDLEEIMALIDEYGLIQYEAGFKNGYVQGGGRGVRGLESREAMIVTREQKDDLAPYLEKATARLTSLEMQDLVMHAYRLGRTHGYESGWSDGFDEGSEPSLAERRGLKWSRYKM